MCVSTVLSPAAIVRHQASFDVMDLSFQLLCSSYMLCSAIISVSTGSQRQCSVIRWGM